MKKHYLALPGIVFIGLIFLLPSGASAANLGQACKAFLSPGICRPNSGSDMCPPVYSLGSGDCSTGLICCDAGYLNSNGSGSGGCTSNSTSGVTSCTLSGGGSGVCNLDSFGTPVCAVKPNSSSGGATGSWSIPQSNGVGCAAPSDCISGYCSPGNASSRVCAVNPASTGGIQPGVGNTGGVQPGVTNTGTNVTLINPLKSGTSLTSFLNNILDFVIYIGSIIVILMLVFVGFKFVVAQGKPAEIEEAKKMLLWTIIGALVLLGAKAISAGILDTVKALGG